MLFIGLYLIFVIFNIQQYFKKFSKSNCQELLVITSAKKGAKSLKGNFTELTTFFWSMAEMF